MGFKNYLNKSFYKYTKELNKKEKLSKFFISKNKLVEKLI